MRMPISRVRRATSHAFRPYTPIVASRSASAPNVLNIVAAARTLHSVMLR